LHGVSPDGSTLAYVDLPRDLSTAVGRLAVMSSHGGTPRYPEAGTTHLDGPEYSADGRWVYVNTENFARAPGHAQVARLPATGGPMEQLIESDTVDWFPHLSPDGAYATYISFPAGTIGHPADLQVEVRLVRTSDWAQPLARFPLQGGQGPSTSTVGRLTAGALPS
jgi:Tol biopolymer transport system component